MNFVGNVGDFLRNFLNSESSEKDLYNNYVMQGNKKDLYDNYVMQGNPFLLDLAGTGKRMNEVGLNPWGGGEDVKTAGLVGFEDWPGPKEHGPFPDIFKTKSINQKGLKSLMEEMQEYRRRGIL